MKINFQNSVKIPTPSEIAQLEASQKAVQYLKDTDWLVIRKLETGQAVPADVLQKRAESRSLVI